MDAVTSPPVWSQAPFVMRYAAGELPRRIVRGPRSTLPPAPPWFESGPEGVPFDFTQSMTMLADDVCRHTAELSHIDMRHVLVGFVQARNTRGHGLQARVTPLRFHGGHLVRHSRGRVFQVQRYVVEDVEMLYLMSFCLPRFLDQSFDEKFVTLFHELFHIGTEFDGDLRRHQGRYCLHTSSKADYDLHMGQLARQYLAGGANPKLYGFLRLSYSQLRQRHGRVEGVVLPRVKIMPVPVG